MSPQPRSGTWGQSQDTFLLEPHTLTRMQLCGLWPHLPPPWQAALSLAVPPNLLHLGPLDVLHVGLYHLWRTTPLCE